MSERHIDDGYELLEFLVGVHVQAVRAPLGKLRKTLILAVHDLLRQRRRFVAVRKANPVYTVLDLQYFWFDACGLGE